MSGPSGTTEAPKLYVMTKDMPGLPESPSKVGDKKQPPSLKITFEHLIMKIPGETPENKRDILNTLISKLIPPLVEDTRVVNATIKLASIVLARATPEEKEGVRAEIQKLLPDQAKTIDELAQLIITAASGNQQLDPNRLAQLKLVLFPSPDFAAPLDVQIQQLAIQLEKATTEELQAAQTLLAPYATKPDATTDELCAAIIEKFKSGTDPDREQILAIMHTICPATEVTIAGLASEMMRLWGTPEEQYEDTLARINAVNITPKAPQVVKPNVVTVTFNESTLSELEGRIGECFRSHDLFQNDLEGEIISVGGNSKTLNPNDPRYTSKKEEAAKKLNDYPTTYNGAVTTLGKLKDQEDAINKLRGKVTETAAEFSKVLEQRKTYILELFTTMATDASYLDEKARKGFESAKSRIMGGTIVLKVPKTEDTAKDRYNPAGEIKLNSSSYDQHNFSLLFENGEELIRQLDDFTKDLEKQLRKISGLRKAISANDPNYEAKKQSVPTLIQGAKGLHDRCIENLLHLRKFSENLNGITCAINKILDAKMDEINKRRTTIVDQVNTLEKEYKTLDSTVNGPASQKTKDLKHLTATSTDLYLLST